MASRSRESQVKYSQKLFCPCPVIFIVVRTNCGRPYLVTTTLARHCRAAGRISQDTNRALQLLLILHEANAVTAAIRLSQTLKMCSDIKGTHSTFGDCSCSSWRMRTYLFLLQTGQSHSWPDSTLYSRQFLHTRTLQPLQHGHRVNIVPSAANG